MIQQLRKIRATMLCALFALTWFVDGYAVDGMSKYAQQQSVSGIVRSPEGDGIPGVNVIVKGTTQGVTTDASGNYTIMVPGPNTTLVFSFVGYQTQEIVVNNQTVINVQMALELTALDEIVVIGYGQREKKDLTGAVAQISSEEITKQVSMSPEMRCKDACQVFS
jgi:hypothetical protein